MDRYNPPLGIPGFFRDFPRKEVLLFFTAPVLNQYSIFFCQLLFCSPLTSSTNVFHCYQPCCQCAHRVRCQHEKTNSTLNGDLFLKTKQKRISKFLKRGGSGARNRVQKLKGEYEKFHNFRVRCTIFLIRLVLLYPYECSAELLLRSP